MPYVLRFNRSAIEARMQRFARLLDLQPANFDGVLQWVLALRRQIGIPDTLAVVGVREADLDLLVPMAVDDPSTGGNPRPVGAAEMRTLFEKAIRGDLT